MSRKVAVKRLWKDVPQEERVDRAFLLTRQGAQDPKWLERREKKLASAQCGAAISWAVHGDGKYHQCTIKVVEGEEFCYLHGGKRPPKPAYTPKPKRSEWEIRKTQLENRKSVLATKLAQVNKQLLEMGVEP